ncbi:MAG TPA: tetratricopeptide repeat protein [Victivallales bacterium]|nr:tetratricopeptide repeat protein [Victivallales bacterium]HRU00887.1 tetratricopeptide repeat protein [Victivallales bacterium]
MHLLKNITKLFLFCLFQVLIIPHVFSQVEPQDNDIERIKLLAAKAIKDMQLDTAIKYQRELLKLYKDPSEKIKAWLILISLLIDNDSIDEAKDELKTFEGEFKAQIFADLDTKANFIYLKSIVELSEGNITNTIEELKNIADSTSLSNKELSCRILLSLSLSYISTENWNEAEKYIKRIETEKTDQEWNEIAEALIFVVSELSGKKIQQIPYLDKEQDSFSNIIHFFSSGQKEKALESYKKIDIQKECRKKSFEYQVWALCIHALHDKDINSASMFINDADKYIRKGALKLNFDIIKADIEYNIGKKDEAIKTYKELIEKYYNLPISKELILKYITGLIETGKNKIAFEEYKRKIISFDDNNRIILSAEIAMSFINAGDFEPVDFIISLISENKSPLATETATFLHAKLLFAKKKYEESAKLFGEILQKKGKYFDDALLWQIKALYNAGNYTELNSSIDRFNKEIANSKNLQEILFYQALSLKNEEKYEKAETAFKDFIEKYPNSPFTPNSIMELADIFFKKQDYSSAENFYLTLSKKYPDNHLSLSANYKGIYSQILQGKFIEAEKNILEFYEKYKSSKEAGFALLWLADFKSANNEKDKAEKVYLKIKDDFSAFPEIASDAMFEAAKIALSVSDTQRAFFMLDELSEKYPDTDACFEGYFLRGDKLSEIGEYEKAIPFFMKIIMKKPDSLLAISSYGRLGDMYFALSNKDNQNLIKACEFYEKIVENKKAPITTIEQALFKLGKCEEKMGDLGAAVKNYREVLTLFYVDQKRGIKRAPLWAVKAAVNAIKIYLEKNDFYSILEAEKLYNEYYNLAPEQIQQMKANINAAKEKLKKKE